MHFCNCLPFASLASQELPGASRVTCLTYVGTFFEGFSPRFNTLLPFASLPLRAEFARAALPLLLQKNCGNCLSQVMPTVGPPSRISQICSYALDKREASRNRFRDTIPPSSLNGGQTLRWKAAATGSSAGTRLLEAPSAAPSAAPCSQRLDGERGSTLAWAAARANNKIKIYQHIQHVSLHI